MPNIKSAKKRVAVNEVKRQRNKAILTHVRTTVKKFNAALDANNIEEAERLLPDTFSVIDSAASKGAIHKNNAANKKAGLAKRLSDVKSGTVVVKIKKDNKTVAAEKALAAKQARDAVRAENAQKAAERAALREEEQKEKSKTAKKPAKKAAAEGKTAKKETAKKDSGAEAKPAKTAKKAKDEEADKKEAKKPLKKLSDKL